jgi:transposase InsO family protein
LQAIGARHLTTKPYRPRTNGKAERFIQTCLREWLYAKPYVSSDTRTAAMPDWLHAYNHHRPHAGLNGLTPAQRLNNVLGNDKIRRLGVAGGREVEDLCGHEHAILGPAGSPSG